MSKLSETRAFLIEQYRCCERQEECGYIYDHKFCGPLQAHHVFQGREKGHEEYDVPINCCLIGERCHPLRNDKFSCWFRDKRTKEDYNVEEWLQGLDLKVKPQNFNREQK
jgi:hypothetical protein